MNAKSSKSAKRWRRTIVTWTLVFFWFLAASWVVACGAALWSGQPALSPAIMKSPEPPMPLDDWSPWSVFHYAEWDTRTSSIQRWSNSEPKSILKLSFGWPMRSHYHLATWPHGHWPGYTWESVPGLVGGLAIEGWTCSYTDGWRRLPLQPSIGPWLGNALFLTFIAFAAWNAPGLYFRERRRWRWLHGECIWCRYDLDGLKRCPECGRTQQFAGRRTSVAEESEAL